jgi:hypothetical protein
VVDFTADFSGIRHARFASRIHHPNQRRNLMFRKTTIALCSALLLATTGGAFAYGSGSGWGGSGGHGTGGSGGGWGGYGGSGGHIPAGGGGGWGGSGGHGTGGGYGGGHGTGGGYGGGHGMGGGYGGGRGMGGGYGGGWGGYGGRIIRVERVYRPYDDSYRPHGWCYYHPASCGF